MPSRPFRAQAAAVALGISALLAGAARAQPVEVTRGPYPAQLMTRAAGALQARDFSAARRLYEAAARQGVAVAATALGQTYDPPQIARMGGTISGDVEQAEQWYQRGVDLGDPAAAALLQSLKNRK